MEIIIDSREQLPYQFATPSQVGTLAVGDYSIKGLEDHHISLERKSLPDLISSLSTGRQRFQKELFKLKAYDYAALILECSLSDLADGNYRSNMNSKSAIQSLVAFSIRYRLPIWFCENRKYAERITQSLLEKYAIDITRKFEAIGNT